MVRHFEQYVDDRMPFSQRRADSIEGAGMPPWVLLYLTCSPSVTGTGGALFPESFSAPINRASQLRNTRPRTQLVELVLPRLINQVIKIDLARFWCQKPEAFARSSSNFSSFATIALRVCCLGSHANAKTTPSVSCVLYCVP